MAGAYPVRSSCIYTHTHTLSLSLSLSLSHTHTHTHTHTQVVAADWQDRVVNSRNDVVMFHYSSQSSSFFAKMKKNLEAVAASEFKKKIPKKNDVVMLPNAKSRYFFLRKNEETNLDAVAASEKTNIKR